MLLGYSVSIQVVQQSIDERIGTVSLVVPAASPQRREIRSVEKRPPGSVQQIVIKPRALFLIPKYLFDK